MWVLVLTGVWLGSELSLLLDVRVCSSILRLRMAGLRCWTGALCFCCVAGILAVCDWVGV